MPEQSINSEFYVSIQPSGYAIEFQYHKLPKSNGGFSDYTNQRQRKARLFNAITCLNAHKRLDSFWTFTIPEKQTHFEKTDFIYIYLFSKLLENLRVRYKRNQSSGLENYIWVAEAQKRGSIHFHLLSTSYLELKYVRKQWNKLLECDANNTQSVHVQRINQTEIRNIAHYFAKYMSKGLTGDDDITESNLKRRPIYGKSFNYSRNFEIVDQIVMRKSLFDKIKTELILPKTVKTFIDKETGEIVNYIQLPTKVKEFQNEKGDTIRMVEHYLYTHKALELCKNLRII